MELNFKNLPQLLNHFKEEETCTKYLEQQLWNGTTTCPHCNSSKKIYTIENGKRYKCAECKKKFSVLVGTIFENTKMKLSLWFAAIYICTAHKKGISSLQLGRDLGVTQKTAWFMLHRIREAMIDKAPKKLSGRVQADETYIAGETKNKHKWQRKMIESNRSKYIKAAPVFGMLEEGGNIITVAVTETNQETLQPIIKNNLEKGSTLVTDGNGAYRHMNEFKHIAISHNQGNYTLGEFHTNSIENFWSLLKRGIVGIYHQVSPKHLKRYCNEFSYRFNTRGITDISRFSLSLTNVRGRLTYNQLTA